ncbi:MAG: hypothetical protein J6A90_05440 [Clostridia bacterium]|nr:hypothetical protein [Clostridia bacterium]
MKKRVLILCLTLVLSLSLFVPLAFADSECEHSYTDDGDCTTPLVCSLCDKIIYVQTSHNFDKTESYSYADGNFLSEGKKTVACTNSGCTTTKELDVKPLVDSLGYSIREYQKNDSTYYSLATSYIFNAKEIKAYANSLGKEYEYGIMCYIPNDLGNDPPINSDGTPDVTVLKIPYKGTNGVCDLTIPSIIEDRAGDEFVFAAYLRFGSDVYYIQSDKIFTDNKDLTIVNCSIVLDKLANN